MNGPWEQRVILRDNNGTDAKRAAAGWHCGENNPSAVITKNGTSISFSYFSSTKTPGRTPGPLPRPTAK